MLKNYDFCTVFYVRFLANCFYSERKNKGIESMKTTSLVYRCASISLRTWRQTTFFHCRACIFHPEASREYGRRTTKLKSGIHRFRRTFHNREREREKRGKRKRKREPEALTGPSLYPYQTRSFLKKHNISISRSHG